MPEDIQAATQPAAPVVVTPIPPEKSTTLQLNKRFPIITTLATVAVTILDLLMQAFADPALAPLIGKWFPMESRIALVAVVTILSRMNWNKRMETTRPIIGTEAAAELPEATGRKL